MHEPWVRFYLRMHRERASASPRTTKVLTKTVRKRRTSRLSETLSTASESTTPSNYVYFRLKGTQSFFKSPRGRRWACYLNVQSQTAGADRQRGALDQIRTSPGKYAHVTRPRCQGRKNHATARRP